LDEERGRKIPDFRGRRYRSGMGRRRRWESSVSFRQDSGGGGEKNPGVIGLSRDLKKEHE